LSRREIRHSRNCLRNLSFNCHNLKAIEKPKIKAEEKKKKKKMNKHEKIALTPIEHLSHHHDVIW
jgi:hypothetical protein